MSLDIPVSVKSETASAEERMEVDAGAAPVKQEEPADKNMLYAVLQFLKKNNLQATEKLLLKEANISEEQSRQAQDGDVTQTLSSYKREGDPCIYTTNYENLKKFIDGSLDAHRCELAMVQYPVFVHMYLELVYNCHQEAAHHFFSRYSGIQENYYEDDLRQLSMVTKQEHMLNNQLMQNFRSSKFVIRMSRDSYTHLKRHLQENKLNLLLNIVQEHLFIDVFDGVPRSKQQIELAAGGLLGEAKREANKGKVYYGLLKEPDLNVPVEEEDEDEKTGKKKKSKKDQVLSRKSKTDPHAPSLTRIPLPELKDAEKAEKVQMYREAMKRVSVGATCLPSICFYTILNAFQGVTCMEISEDTSLLAMGCENSSVRVWSLTPSKLRVMKPPLDLETIDKEADDVLERIMDDRTASEYKVLSGHSGPVYAISFSHDKTQLLSASEDGTIRLWSLLTWTNLVVYKGHVYPVWDVQFSPRGYYFASCGADRTARVWSTDHYQPVRIFAGHLADVEKVQFHPNCNYVATGSCDRTVRLWDILTGNCVRVMTGPKAAIQYLTFSPDGRHLAGAGADKMIFLWDLSSGDCVGQLRGHTDTVECLCYSRDGSVLASGGQDQSVRLWDVSRCLEESESDGVMSTLQADYMLGSYPTKATPVLAVHFTRRNLLISAGPYTS